MTFKIWHKGSWYQYWPPTGIGGSFDPPPTDRFSSYEQALRIVETQRLYGAEIYRLVGAPEGTKVKRVA